MNRLRIIIEKTGPGPEDYRCLYVGENGLKADAIFSEPSANRKAEYRPAPVRFARQVVSEPTVVAEPSVETPKQESPKPTKSKSKSQ